MIKKLVPRQPDPFIKKAADQEIAKFGHLNWLIDQINLAPPGGILSVVGGTNITIDNTDPANPIINASGGGGENLAQTLAIGDDANQLNIINLNTLQGGNAVTLTISDDNSGGVTINPQGILRLESTGTGMFIDAGSDIVFGSVGLANLDASAITGSLIVGGLGIDAAVISHAGDMTFSTTAAGNFSIGSDRSVGIAAASNFNVDLATSGTGIITASSAAGIITLTPMSGYTAATGTESGATFDEGTVTLPQLAQRVAKLWNAMMTKGYLIT